MPVFELLKTDSQGKPVGPHYANGMEYNPGDRIDSVDDLEILLPNKFHKVNDGSNLGADLEKDMEIAELKDRIRILEQQLNPDFDLSHKDEDLTDESENESQDISEKKGPLVANGVDATSRFEGAESNGLMIFTNSKKGKNERFTIIDVETKESLGGEKLMTELQVERLISEMS